MDINIEVRESLYVSLYSSMETRQDNAMKIKNRLGLCCYDVPLTSFWPNVVIFFSTVVLNPIIDDTDGLYL